MKAFWINYIQDHTDQRIKTVSACIQDDYYEYFNKDHVL